MVDCLDTRGTQAATIMSLEEDLVWLAVNKDIVTHLDTRGDATNELLHSEVMRNLDRMYVAATSIKTALDSRSPEHVSPKEQAAEIVSTGAIQD